ATEPRVIKLACMPIARRVVKAKCGVGSPTPPLATLSGAGCSQSPFRVATHDENTCRVTAEQLLLTPFLRIISPLFWIFDQFFFPPKETLCLSPRTRGQNAVPQLSAVARNIDICEASSEESPSIGRFRK